MPGIRQDALRAARARTPADSVPHRNPTHRRPSLQQLREDAPGPRGGRENLYIRDKEAAAKYKREAELQAERLPTRRRPSREFGQELATMLHQKHLAERQNARASECRSPNAHPPSVCETHLSSET